LTPSFSGVQYPITVSGNEKGEARSRHDRDQVLRQRRPGAVIASQILAKVFFLMGKYPQCFSVFGGERRGAPVASFLRVDDRKILLKCEIMRPDELHLPGTRPG